MFDFPSSPSVGAVYTSGGVSYAWDGQAWNGGPSVSTDTSAAMLAQLSARENILYNADFSISQKAGYALVNTHGAYFADGWVLTCVPATNAAAKVNGRQISSGPLQKGRFRAQYTCATAKTTLAATDYVALVHHIEGIDLSPLSWGLAGGVPAVVRFGFKGPAGTYSVGLFDDTATNYWTAPFTITAGQANQDTIQVFAIPPPPATGQWTTSNVKAATLRFGFAAGSTFTGAMTVGGAWGSSNFVMPTGGFNFLSSTANVVEIFDVKLVGDPDNLRVDPGFAPVDNATELQRCQRYYQSSIRCTAVGYMGAAGAALSWPMGLPVAMRTVGVSTLRAAGTYANASAATFGANDVASATFTITVTGVGGGGAYNWIYDLDAQLT